MVKLNRIYTGTGDEGSTGLVTGPRRSKADPRLHAIGEVDEANSTIGMARTLADAESDAVLSRIQNDLFDLGADLATPGEVDGALRLAFEQVAWLESAIDRVNADLPPLNSFILPGGAPLASWLFLARAVVRRAERACVALAEAEQVGPPVIRYLNRLSDYLFVAGRAANVGGMAEVLWVPGANR